MKWTTKKLRSLKIENGTKKLSMLTCYDYQTACALDQSDVDLILVGDSLGNVILGYETTCSVTIQEMITFGAAVKRGAKNKFTIIDMPFGTYANSRIALENAIPLFQKTGAEALKLEGSGQNIISSIEALVNTGIPVVGHIGLTPQFFHQQGGYFTHGKTKNEKAALLEQAKKIQEAGASLLVLECVTSEVAEEITKQLKIPTIGIGSGQKTDGQVLVINDLLGSGPTDPPSFCRPKNNFYQQKLEAIKDFIQEINNNLTSSDPKKDKYENIYN